MQFELNNPFTICTIDMTIINRNNYQNIENENLPNNQNIIKWCYIDSDNMRLLRYENNSSDVGKIKMNRQEI